MKKSKSKYEVVIRKAMLENDIGRNELANAMGYNSGANLMTAIKKGTLGDKYNAPLAKELKIDEDMLLELKDLCDAMSRLETDIEVMQNTLSKSSGVPAEARGQLSKELEFKSKIFILSKDRLETITDFIKSNI